MTSTKKQELDELLQAAITAYQAGRLNDAIKRLAGRTDEFPKASKLWGYLGFLYSEAGKTAQAVRAFQTAVRLSPRSEKASLGLFHSLWRMGKSDAAFDEMRRLVRRGDSPEYRRLIRDMLAEEPAGDAKGQRLATV